MLVCAGIAYVEVTAERGCATGADVPQHLLMGRRERMALAKLLAVRTYHIGDLPTRPLPFHTRPQPRTRASVVPSRSKGLRVRRICSVLTWMYLSVVVKDL